jgi:hypothetical protein
MKWHQGRTWCLFTRSHAHPRKKLFNWIGAVAPADWCLFFLQSRNLSLRGLEEAKSRQVGTVNQDVGEQFLVAKGFSIGQNLQSSTKYEFNDEKLKAGRVDLWLSNAWVASYLVRQVPRPQPGGRRGICPMNSWVTLGTVNLSGSAANAARTTPHLCEVPPTNAGWQCPRFCSWHPWLSSTPATPPL